MPYPTNDYPPSTASLMYAEFNRTQGPSPNSNPNPNPSPKGVNRGCHRVTVDIPTALWEEIKALADAPPKISVAEYVRRVVAHYMGFEYPNRQVRTSQGRTISGSKKIKPGPQAGTTKGEAHYDG